MISDVMKLIEMIHTFPQVVVSTRSHPNKKKYVVKQVKRIAFILISDIFIPLEIIFHHLPMSVTLFC